MGVARRQTRPFCAVDSFSRSSPPPETDVPQLIAEGMLPRQRWRIELEPGQKLVLGRGREADLPVPWDPHISRRHVELVWTGRVLDVRRLTDATNPLIAQGETVERVEIPVGQHFVLGSTCFMVGDPLLRESPTSPSAAPVEEVTFSRQSLQHVQFRDPDKRIEVLSHLPVILGDARTEAELHLRLVNLLLAGTQQAEAAAIVEVNGTDDVNVFRWDRRRETDGYFRPSSRLVNEAILRQRQSVLHVWENAETHADFTASQELDWAFCTPILGPAGEKWGLYVAGRFGGMLSRATGGQAIAALQPDVKFAEIVAEFISAIRRLNHLERTQAGLRQFFPPVILNALGDSFDTSLLVPRESDVTVLFCDLRGFSRKAESQQDDLKGLLDRVSRALGVMTRNILAQGGVIGDFQGDAAMGFWGWPVASEEAPLQACRAALAVRREFTLAAGKPGHPLADFEMGIGLARGRAVAGKIGTDDHVKVTVFGPVVNLASRLEGMTKQLHVPILLDESLAKIARESLPSQEGRVRQLARVLPFGMETPVTVHELLPSAAEYPDLQDDHLVAYERAVDHFLAGRWEAAYRDLRLMPPGDRAQDFLALLITQHNRVAPSDWQGIVRLPGK